MLRHIYLCNIYYIESYMEKRIWICWLVAYCVHQVFPILVEKPGPGTSSTWTEETQYRDRSVIPVPSKDDQRKLSQVNYGNFVPQRSNMKRWKIGRIFYTLPIGATFPVYFTSRKGDRKFRARGKKSKIYDPRFMRDNWRLDDPRGITVGDAQ